MRYDSAKQLLDRHHGQIVTEADHRWDSLVISVSLFKVNFFPKEVSTYEVGGMSNVVWHTTSMS